MSKWWPLAALFALAACASEPTEEEDDPVKVAEAFYERGFFAYQQGRYEAAATDFFRAIRVLPDFPRAVLMYADSTVEWSDQLLARALDLLKAGQTGGAEDRARALTAVDPLIKKAIALQNAARATYEDFRSKRKHMRNEYMKSTFGLAKLHYYRIISPHSPYTFAETEEVKDKEGKVIGRQLRDPLDREELMRDRDRAIGYLEELLSIEAEQPAIETRRWLAALLLYRNDEKQNDRARSHTMLRQYLGYLTEVKKNAREKIQDKEQLRIYVEFIDREIKATQLALNNLEKG
jgi:Tfp pilus assembly protein PilF